MLSASEFLRKHWLILIVSIIGTVVGYRVLYSQVLVFKIFIDALLLKIPLVKNVVKLFYMSRFTSLLGQFYEAGVSPVISFGLLASIFDNFSYKRKMIEIKNSISAGFSIYESMEGSELFDPILIQIISVGENTGSLTEVLKKISVYYTASLKNAIDALMAIIEPLLMAFVACIVGVLLGAIYLPMADMVNQIGN
ncbi:MAG: type II secretion system F family protein [Candidatus Peribacteria bacterium]|jgi:type IV pilus assembly protein PilC|nr:type II secretion system F family protein [Candidatus Peribacteria bacterium]